MGVIPSLQPGGQYEGGEGKMKILVAILSFITVIALLAAFVSLAAIIFGVVCHSIMLLLPDCIRKIIQGD